MQGKKRHAGNSAGGSCHQKAGLGRQAPSSGSKLNCANKERGGGKGRGKTAVGRKNVLWKLNTRKQKGSKSPLGDKRENDHQQKQEIKMGYVLVTGDKVLR